MSVVVCRGSCQIGIGHELGEQGVAGRAAFRCRRTFSGRAIVFIVGLEPNPKNSQVATTVSRNPILTSKPMANAMQTFLSFLAISDPSLRALMIIGALSLGLLAVFLRRKLG